MSETQTRNFTFGCHGPRINAELVADQMRLGHRYRNVLVELERKRREEVRYQGNLRCRPVPGSESDNQVGNGIHQGRTCHTHQDGAGCIWRLVRHRLARREQRLRRSLVAATGRMGYSARAANGEYMANALFEDDVDLELIGRAVRGGWRFKSGRGWVSIRPPGGGALIWHGKNLKRISIEMLQQMKPPKK